MFVVLNGVANIKWLLSVNIGEMLGHVEGNAIENFARRVINEFKLYVLLVLSHEFTCTEIHYTSCPEHRLGISGAVRIEFA